MKKGFTLVDMILVVAIIAILSGVIFTISLNSFKNSKIKGFSNEALSLIQRLYDYQNSRSAFVDQVGNNDVEKNYNIIFGVENENLIVKLRNQKNTIDEVLLSSIAFVNDLNIELYEDDFSLCKKVTSSSPYIFSFDSRGRIVSKTGGNPLNSLKINICVDKEGYKNSIIITTPPSGNITLEKGDGNE